MASFDEIQKRLSATSTTTQRTGGTYADITGVSYRRPNRTTTPTQDPGFLKTMAADALYPFARMAMNVEKAYGHGKNIGNMLYRPLVGQDWRDYVKPVDAKEKRSNAFFEASGRGPVTAIGQSGHFGRDLVDSLGVGTELASWIPITKAATSLSKLGWKGAAYTGMKMGAKEGLFGGSMYGLGREVQNPNATVGSTAVSTALGGLAGTAGGGVLGGTLPLGGFAARSMYNRVKPASIFKGMTPAQNKAVTDMENAYIGIAREYAPTRRYVSEVGGITAAKNARGTTGTTPMRKLSEAGIVPEIEGTKFATERQALEAKESARFLQDLEKDIVAELDRQASGAKQISLDEMEKAAIKAARSPRNVASGKAEKLVRQIRKEFAQYRREYGSAVTALEADAIKTQRWIEAFGTKPTTRLEKLLNDADYYIGSAFRGGVEELGAKYGVPMIAQLNREIGDILEASKFLMLLNGRAVAYGRMGTHMLRLMGTIAGASHGALGALGGALGMDAVANVLRTMSVADPARRLVLGKLRNQMANATPEVARQMQAWLKEVQAKPLMRLGTPALPEPRYREMGPGTRPDISGVRVDPAKKTFGTDVQTGKFKRVWTSETEQPKGQRTPAKSQLPQKQKEQPFVPKKTVIPSRPVPLTQGSVEGVQPRLAGRGKAVSSTPIREDTKPVIQQPMIRSWYDEQPKSSLRNPDGTKRMVSLEVKDALRKYGDNPLADPDALAILRAYDKNSTSPVPNMGTISRTEAITAVDALKRQFGQGRNESYPIGTRIKYDDLNEDTSMAKNTSVMPTRNAETTAYGVPRKKSKFVALTADWLGVNVKGEYEAMGLRHAERSEWAVRDTAATFLKNRMKEGVDQVVFVANSSPKGLNSNPMFHQFVLNHIRKTAKNGKKIYEQAMKLQERLTKKYEKSGVNKNQATTAKDKARYDAMAWAVKKVGKKITNYHALASESEGFLNAGKTMYRGRVLNVIHDKEHPSYPYKVLLTDVQQMPQGADFTKAAAESGIEKDAHLRLRSNNVVLDADKSPELRRALEGSVPFQDVPVKATIGITSASERIPKLKALNDKARAAMMAGDSAKAKAYRDEILDVGEQRLKELFDDLPDVTIKVRRSLGDYFGDEPTFLTDMTFTKKSEGEVVRRLSQLGKELNQDSIHIGKLLDNPVESATMGKVMADGYQFEPQITLRFNRAVSDREFVAFNNMLREEFGFAGSTLLEDGKGIFFYNVTQYGTTPQKFIRQAGKLVKRVSDMGGVEVGSSKNLRVTGYREDSRRLLIIGDRDSAASRSYKQGRSELSPSEQGRYSHLEPEGVKKSAIPEGTSQMKVAGLRSSGKWNSRAVNKDVLKGTDAKLSKGTKQLLGPEIDAHMEEFGSVFRPNGDIIEFPNGRVFSDLTKEQGTLYLSEMAVSKNARGKGLGSDYMKAVRKYADDTDTQLTVYKITPSSVGFWKKMFPDAQWADGNIAFDYKPWDKKSTSIMPESAKMQADYKKTISDTNFGISDTSDVVKGYTPKKLNGKVNYSAPVHLNEGGKSVTVYGNKLPLNNLEQKVLGKDFDIQAGRHYKWRRVTYLYDGRTEIRKTVSRNQPFAYFSPKHPITGKPYISMIDYSLRGADASNKSVGFSIQTFYHEVGHAIDRLLDANTQLIQKYADRIKPEVETLARERFERGMRPSVEKYGLKQEHLDRMWAGKDVYMTEVDPVKWADRPYAKLSAKRTLRNYFRGKDEVFAEAYSMYRVNPERLKELSPNMYSLLDEIVNSI